MSTSSPDISLQTGNAAAPSWQLWLGRVLSGLVVAMLCFSGAMKVSQSPDVIKGLVEQMGYPATSIVLIGAAELLCALLYAVPQTAILGAILVTGYLGGATATHVRAGDAFIAPVILGVIAWAALVLRDPRLRTLLPLRRLS